MTVALDIEQLFITQITPMLISALKTILDNVVRFLVNMIESSLKQHLEQKK